MANLILNRRRLLGIGAAGASSLILAGCDQFDIFAQRGGDWRNFLERANQLTYAAQRALVPDQALQREFAESEIRQGQRPNGSTDPRNIPEYAELEATQFANYKLSVTGMVETPKSYTLAELRNMPARTQITRHDCVEGWSTIAKWTGTPLGAVLDQSKVKPGAKFIIYHCYDKMGGGLSAPEPYYESSDLIDAYHPQTILAYGLNNENLPVSNGAPVRVRIERALGYKQPKYVHTIEVADTFTQYGMGRGGYWEDHGYDWYGGI